MITQQGVAAVRLAAEAAYSELTATVKIEPTILLALLADHDALRTKFAAAEARIAELEAWQPVTDDDAMPLHCQCGDNDCNTKGWLEAASTLIVQDTDETCVSFDFGDDYALYRRVGVAEAPSMSEKLNALSAKLTAAEAENERLVYQSTAMLNDLRAQLAAAQTEIERLTNVGLDAALGEAIKVDETDDYARLWEQAIKESDNDLRVENTDLRAQLAAATWQPVGDDFPEKGVIIADDGGWWVMHEGQIVAGDGDGQEWSVDLTKGYAVCRRVEGVQ